MAVIIGTEIADNLLGTRFDDSISGLAGDDLISGDNGNDIISGGTGSDTLYGDVGRDYLLGGDGNDFLDGSGSGGDTIDGGSDQDTLSFVSFRTDGFLGLHTVTGGADSDIFQLNLVPVIGLSVRLGIGEQTLITDFVTMGPDADKIAFGNLDSLSVSGRRSIVFSGEWAGGSLTLGAEFDKDFNGLMLQVVTLRDVANNKTYLIVDNDFSGTLSARDEVIAFVGAPVLDASNFATGTFSPNVLIGTALGGCFGCFQCHVWRRFWQWRQRHPHWWQ